MKRVVAAKDESSFINGDPENKRLKTEDDAEGTNVLELDEHSFECVICFGKYLTAFSTCLSPQFGS
jgi:hypothetical protein